MKKVLFFLLIIYSLFVNISFVAATGGALRSSSIKTCPNGKTYGKHGSSGNVHWHVAKYNGKQYFPDGDAISNDPCPSSSKNEGTAGSTNENNSSSNKPSSGSSSSNNNVVKKSSDTSILWVKIDNEVIVLAESINYSTKKDMVNIEVQPTSSKAKVDLINKELVIGENKIKFTITAEDGTKKDYIISIIREKKEVKLTLKEFIISDSPLEFKDNKVTIQKLSNEKSLNYSYTLDDENAKLKIIVDGVETDKLNNLKDRSVIKLVVYNEYDDINEYEIIVEDASFIMTMLVYGITIVICLAPFMGIGIVVFLKLKKKI